MRTNVDSDNLAYSELDAWIDAGCPTTALNCPGPNRDATLFRRRDGCEFCLGAKGGVPGNENRIGGVVVCDYCSYLLMNIKPEPQVNNPAPVFVWPVEALAAISIPTGWNHSYNPQGTSLVSSH